MQSVLPCSNSRQGYGVGGARLGWGNAAITPTHLACPRRDHNSVHLPRAPKINAQKQALKKPRISSRVLQEYCLKIFCCLRHEVELVDKTTPDKTSVDKTWSAGTSRHNMVSSDKTGSDKTRVRAKPIWTERMCRFRLWSVLTDTLW